MEKVSQQTYAASFLKFLNSRRHDFVQELQLEINRGTPRYYIFRKEERTLNFHKITYHEQVTQCLASVQNSPWYIVVAKANFRIDNPPSLNDLVAFKVTGGTIVKLNMGTWHAGPLFQVNVVTFIKMNRKRKLIIYCRILIRWISLV
jgi:ureidoglycolate hydrolase